MSLKPTKRLIRMTVEYDGSNYAGWQRQANAGTVQQTFEEALERHLRQPIRITASGRTDSGVHAKGQVISFPVDSTIDAAAIGRGLSLYLPDDIAIVDARDAPADFDARRSARLRWYQFYLCNRNVRPAIGRRYLTHVRGALDVDKMKSAAGLLSGDHNFSAFRSSACTASRTNLTMRPIDVTELSDDIIRLDFRCRSFLHNMVRILTGTIVAAGHGKLTNGDITDMLATGKRHRHAVTVKPNGLVLYRVYYEDDIVNST